MKIVVQASERDVAIAHVTGRVDMASAADLKQRLLAELAAGHLRLLVDLGDSTFLDSSGLKALVDCFKAAYLAGGALRLARVSIQARLIMEYTTIDQTIRPYETVEQALDGL